ncbi:uncharacterized protein LOC120384666 [Mauremys reevesii]|uniref:uncharacterized protein LOC120384666 n=1 Tax=Mauremys reevesii TaxID=260615 RepID=UPI00193FB139|nr:uncharacterized protein LOC120384666 [Mauremys reevesii]
MDAPASESSHRECGKMPHPSLTHIKGKILDPGKKRGNFYLSREENHQNYPTCQNETDAQPCILTPERSSICFLNVFVLRRFIWNSNRLCPSIFSTLYSIFMQLFAVVELKTFCAPCRQTCSQWKRGSEADIPWPTGTANIRVECSISEEEDKAALGLLIGSILLPGIGKDWENSSFKRSQFKKIAFNGIAQDVNQHRIWPRCLAGLQLNMVFFTSPL